MLGQIVTAISPVPLPGDDTSKSPSTSRRQAGPSSNRHDPYLTPALSVPQTALSASPASPATTQTVYTIDAGFGAPSAAMAPTPQTHQLGVSYGLPPATPRLPASLSGQLLLLQIPSASFATHFTTQQQPVLPLLAYQSSIYTIDSSASSTSAVASSSMTTINRDDFLIPSSPSAPYMSSDMNYTSIRMPTGTIGSGGSSVVTSVSVDDTSLVHSVSIPISRLCHRPSGFCNSVYPPSTAILLFFFFAVMLRRMLSSCLSVSATHPVS